MAGLFDFDELDDATIAAARQQAAEELALGGAERSQEFVHLSGAGNRMGGEVAPEAEPSLAVAAERPAPAPSPEELTRAAEQESRSQAMAKQAAEEEEPATPAVIRPEDSGDAPGGRCEELVQGSCPNVCVGEMDEIAKQVGPVLEDQAQCCADRDREELKVKRISDLVELAGKSGVIQSDINATHEMDTLQERKDRFIELIIAKSIAYQSGEESKAGVRPIFISKADADAAAGADFPTVRLRRRNDIGQWADADDADVLGSAGRASADVDAAAPEHSGGSAESSGGWERWQQRDGRWNDQWWETSAYCQPWDNGGGHSWSSSSWNSTATAKPKSRQELPAPRTTRRAQAKARQETPVLAATEPWQEVVDDTVMCRACNKPCDGSHELSKSHFRKLAIWEEEYWNPGPPKAPEEPWLAFKTDDINGGMKLLWCIMCKKWAVDFEGKDILAGGGYDGQHGQASRKNAKEHARHLRNYNDWWDADQKRAMRMEKEQHHPELREVRKWGRNTWRTSSSSNSWRASR